MTHRTPLSLHRLQALTAVLLSASLALVACGEKASTSASAPAASAATASPAGKNVLTIAMSTKDKGVAIESDASLHMKTAGVYETLTNVTVDGQVHPALATAWKRTSPTTWEFTLRPTVKFHDGTVLDADAVVTALTYVMKTPTPPRSLKSTGLVAEAVNANTVRLTTKQPDPVLPLRLGSSTSAILAKAAYASSPANPIGFATGPFKMVKHDAGVSMTYERFDGYWDGKPALDGVVVRFVTDHDGRYNALKVGEVQIADSVAPNHILEAKKDSHLRVDGIALPRSTTLYTNVTKPVLGKLQIRQAIDLLIDREAIAATVLEGSVTPAAGYFGNAAPWAPKAAPRPADFLEQAKKLIAESGAKPADLKLNLMTYTGRPELAGAANIIKANLEQAGFVITLDVVEYTTVLEPKALAKEHDLILMSRSFYFDMPDAAGYLTSDFGCEGSLNMNAFCDKAFDAIVQEAAKSEKTEERTAGFAKAAQYLIDHKIGLPIYHDTSRRVFSARLKDITIDPLDQRMVTQKTSMGN